MRKTDAESNEGDAAAFVRQNAAFVTQYAGYPIFFRHNHMLDAARMALILVCLSWFVVGGVLRFCFRRVSWAFLLTSVAISVAGWLAVRAAFGEIVRPFRPVSESSVQLIIWNLRPWLLFALVPLQLGYFLVVLGQSCFSRSGST